jgi:hypothetical protein
MSDWDELGRLAMSTDVEWDEQDQGDETQRVSISPDDLDQLAIHAIAGLLGIALRRLLDTMERVVYAVRRRDANTLQALDGMLWCHRRDAETALDDAKLNGLIADGWPGVEVLSEARRLQRSVAGVVGYAPEEALKVWPVVSLSEERLDALGDIITGLHLELEETEDGATVSRLDEASTTSVPAERDKPKRRKKPGRTKTGMLEKTEKQYQKWDDMARNGMSHGEIASECGVERGTVSSGIKRLRDKGPHR